MKKIRIRLSLEQFLLIFGMLLVAACYEPTEGCLDVTATNFAADADDQCEDCCTYPFMKLNLAHMMGDTNFIAGGIYSTPFDPDHYFKLINARFYLSNLQMGKSNGSAVGVNDRISLTVLNNLGVDETVTVEDNYNIVTKSKFEITIGDFRDPASYDSLKFFVGIPDPVNSTDRELVSADHPLRADSSLHWSRTEGYVFIDILLTRDSMPNTDTLNLKIGGSDKLVEVLLENIQTVNPGFDAQLALEIDYLEWFKGINFVTDSETEMVDKIVNNAANAFSIQQ